jgi:asparagine synthase (glutamine-hydrolysing)
VCGICGSTFDPERRAVVAMCGALLHRGPDDQADYLSPQGDVALGARRLSIIDLEAGRQPRGNEDGTVQAVLNGEIYNHPAVREQLLGRGHELRGRSDTEILPHLYEDYGEDFVQALEGMFALAIWDERRGRLLLARDRFGEKPLFYARSPTGLVFASELTALVAGLGTVPDLDPAALDAFFVLGYVPRHNGSILADVQQLPPGHLLAWDRESGGAEQRRYWSPPRPAAAAPAESPRELAAETGRLLERSLDGRLLADVPLGVFLSGGVDSTAIAAIAARRLNGPLRTFTIGYEGADGAFDERPAARRVAALLGAEHREVVLGPGETAELVPRLLASLDQPLADPATVPLHHLSKFARAEVTVALGGDGADELFGGYPRYAHLDRAATARSGAGRVGAVVRGLAPPAQPDGPPARRALDLLVPRPFPERHLDWVTAGRRQARARLYGPRLRPWIERDGVLAELRGEFERAGSVPASGALMRVDQLNWLPDDVLAKSDRAGMFASLELRTPYLQRELAEFAAGLAPTVHLRRGGKHLLRLLLAALLPEAPRRRKVAFLPPVAAWLRGPLAPLFEGQIAAGSLYAEGWVDPVAAARLLAEHRRGDADRSGLLWPLLAAGLWLDRFRGQVPG